MKNKGGGMKVIRYLREQIKNKTNLAISKNSQFVYKAGADVLATWKKQGWQPPSEYRTDYEFGKRKP